MEDVSSCYRGMFLTMRQRPEQREHMLTMLNDIAAQFDSSFLGIAFAIVSSEGIWTQFRQFVQKFNTGDSIRENEMEPQLCQSWQQYVSSLVSFMASFNLEFCECGGDARECPFTDMCSHGSAQLTVSVSESYFSARIISIRLFQAILPLWRGLLSDEEDEEQDGSEAATEAGSRALPAHFTDFLVDVYGNDLVLQGLTLLILSAKLTDHSCVVINKLKQGKGM